MTAAEVVRILEDHGWVRLHLKREVRQGQQYTMAYYSRPDGSGQPVTVDLTFPKAELPPSLVREIAVRTGIGGLES